jgi:hypothetical protein
MVAKVENKYKWLKSNQKWMETHVKIDRNWNENNAKRRFSKSPGVKTKLHLFSKKN